MLEGSGWLTDYSSVSRTSASIARSFTMLTSWHNPPGSQHDVSVTAAAAGGRVRFLFRNAAYLPPPSFTQVRDHASQHLTS
jgi:hypothetical protein